MSSNAVLRPSSLPVNPLLPDLLSQALVASHAANAEPLDPVPIVEAVAAAARIRLDAFASGVAQYRNAPHQRDVPPPPSIWSKGAATLKDYGGTGAPVLIVPSLVNRSTILDLGPDRSLLRAMAAGGLHPFLLDWGIPAATERGYGIGDYLHEVLMPAMDAVVRIAGEPLHLAGYCMGGTLAVAAAVLAPRQVATLTAIAAPWDFHADTSAVQHMLTLMRPALELALALFGEAPFDLVQALFAGLDPTLVGRKFRRFAALDPASDEARRFVVVEDWLNDPVPLAAAVARECLFNWYGENTPGRGLWQVGGTRIDPATITCPALVLVPNRDRIVPPESARALARALPNVKTRSLPLGHIGMMAASRAPELTYQPLIDWLTEHTSR